MKELARLLAAVEKAFLVKGEVQLYPDKDEDIKQLHRFLRNSALGRTFKLKTDSHGVQYISAGKTNLDAFATDLKTRVKADEVTYSKRSASVDDSPQTEETGSAPRVKRRPSPKPTANTHTDDLDSEDSGYGSTLEDLLFSFAEIATNIAAMPVNEDPLEYQAPLFLTLARIETDRQVAMACTKMRQDSDIRALQQNMDGVIQGVNNRP